MDITKFTSKKFLVPGLIILILIFLATFPLYGGGYYMRVLSTILMYVTLAVSWAMFSGPTGYMSLAPAAFLGVGIYLSSVFFSTSEVLLPLPAVIFIGALASFILALIVGIITLRLRGIYFAIFTFGLVVLLSELIMWIEINLNEVSGRFPYLMDIEPIFYITLAICVATLLTTYFIRRSRLGLALQSIGGNEEAAAHMGVNTTRVKIITFAISAAFMGAVGAITAPRLIYVSPHIAFDVGYSFLPVLMAVFGGMRQFYGPIIGALVLAFAEVRLRPLYPYYYMLSFGIILIIIIFFLPAGLVGLIQKLQDRLGGLLSKLRKGGKAEQHANT